MMGPFGAGRVGGMKKAKGHRHSKKLYIEQDKLQEDSVKLSASRIAQSICYELGEEPNFDDLLIIGAMVTTSIKDKQGSVSLAVLVRLFNGYVSKDPIRFLVIPHEKGNWAKKRNIPQVRHINTKAALRELRGVIEDTVLEIRSSVIFDYIDDPTRIRKAVENAFKREIARLRTEAELRISYQ